MTLRLDNYIYKDNPCKPDCQERHPGCNCKKRKDWIADKEARKAEVLKKKDADKRVAEVLHGKKWGTK